jgi:hypothetical protein
VGERLFESLKCEPTFEKAEGVAADTWEMRSCGRGHSWKANDYFEGLRGKQVRTFVAANQSALGSYCWRLCAIRELARALVHDHRLPAMIAKLATQVAAGNLQEDELRAWVQEFRRRAGRGWGPTSVYHLLADLGVTPKPDIHLYQSAVDMGLVSRSASNRNGAERRSPNERMQHEVVWRTIELAREITPTAWAEAPNALREVDKVPMEWSRQGLRRTL